MRISSFTLCFGLLLAGCSTVQEVTQDITDTLTYPLDFILPQDSETTKRAYDAILARSSITVDGKLDERAWDHAFWAEGFTKVVEQTGGETTPTPGSEQVDLAIVHEQYRVIIAFRCTDKALVIPHEGTERNQPLWEGDSVGVLIDAEGNGINIRAVYVNPNNAVSDLNLVSVEKDGDPGSWEANAKFWDDPEIKTGASVTESTDSDSGETTYEWTVEIAIPIRSLTMKLNEIESGMEWPAQFIRTNAVNEEDTEVETTLWSPSRIYFYPGNYGTLRFL